MKKTVLILWLSAASVAAYANNSDDHAEFRYPGTYSSGAANIATPEGEYFYSTPVNDHRQKNLSAYTAGKIPRQSYDLLSDYRTAALWQMEQAKKLAYDKEIARQNREIERARIKRAARHKKPCTPAGPEARVIMRGNDICVPTREFVFSPDWSAHLICWSSENKRVE